MKQPSTQPSRRRAVSRFAPAPATTEAWQRAAEIARRSIREAIGRKAHGAHGCSTPAPSTGASDGAEVSRLRAAAGAGVAGRGEALPWLERIQRCFGEHDLSRVRAHGDARAAAAAAAIGAEAFTMGEHVVFARPPTLRVAAHEAAHVVQQRAGLQLARGVGERGDRHEAQAEAVADRVVAGASVEAELGAPATRRVASAAASRESGAPAGGSVQRAEAATARSAADAAGPTPVEVREGRLTPASHATILAREADRWFAEYKRQRVALVKLQLDVISLVAREHIGREQLFERHADLCARYNQLVGATKVAFESWGAILAEVLVTLDEPTRRELEAYREEVKEKINLGLGAVLALAPLTKVVPLLTAGEVSVSAMETLEPLTSVGLDLAKEGVAGIVVDAILPMPLEPRAADVDVWAAEGDRRRTELRVAVERHEKEASAKGLGPMGERLLERIAAVLRRQPHKEYEVLPLHDLETLVSTWFAWNAILTEIAELARSTGAASLRLTPLWDLDLLSWIVGEAARIVNESRTGGGKYVAVVGDRGEDVVPRARAQKVVDALRRDEARMPRQLFEVAAPGRRDRGR